MYVYIYHLSHRGAEEAQSDETRPPIGLVVVSLKYILHNRLSYHKYVRIKKNGTNNT